MRCRHAIDASQTSRSIRTNFTASINSNLLLSIIYFHSIRVDNMRLKIKWEDEHDFLNKGRNFPKDFLYLSSVKDFSIAGFLWQILRGSTEPLLNFRVR